MSRGTFQRIPAEKQRLILDTAMHEFASKGFHKANINTIAERAGISVGAMYKYFSSKQELFLETLQLGIDFLNDTYAAVSGSPGNPFEKIRAVFTNALAHALDNPQVLQLYLSLLSPSMDDLAATYARTIEEVGHTHLKKIVADGIRDGFIRRDLDQDIAILFLDNHLMMFVFSQVSAYLKIRQETFLEGRVNPERFIRETVLVCKRMFGTDETTLPGATRSVRQKGV
ncbi:MAG TPA: TetR/AcrR family transcriptional regulator [Deltaproteobacteria bacterium]|nr:TetR/AcrR family transcriptional regulator [Deltaproteobacteria bacterium]HQI80185.1 TetR/AcrR family transcriptional regulator [Deltaproteobacteria bacterium]